MVVLDLVTRVTRRPMVSRLHGNDDSGVQDWYDGAYCWVGFMGLLCYEVAVRGCLVEPYVFES